MSNEEFEKWADEKGQNLTFRKHFGEYDSTSTQLMWMGWQARQPEIDAKDKVIDGLALEKGLLKAEVGRLTDENAALKAELRTLRDGIQTMGDALADGVWAHIISSDDDLNALDAGVSSVVGKLTALHAEVDRLRKDNQRLQDAINITWQEPKS